MLPEQPYRLRHCGFLQTSLQGTNLQRACDVIQGSVVFVPDIPSWKSAQVDRLQCGSRRNRNRFQGCYRWVACRKRQERLPTEDCPRRSRKHDPVVILVLSASPLVPSLARDREIDKAEYVC
jgi:hypothetical protein